MTDIRFIPIFDDDIFLASTQEYENIWKEKKELILGAFKTVTGLYLVEARIAAIVYEGRSFSGRRPNDIMLLNYKPDIEIKKATLVHELSHRLLFNLKNRIHGTSVDEHKDIFLFLYDVWIELFGKDFADKMVEIEKAYGEVYLESWNYIFNLSDEERKLKLKELLNKG
jgi:hypothetical protein